MLGCPEAAQDATQQVFANAYRDLAESNKELDVKPWLYAIARNHCTSVLRSRRPDPAEVDDFSHGLGADHVAEGHEGFQDLLSDVGELPERQRAAVMMATLGGFSHSEIATAVGCETEQVKAILFQARTALSERAEARDASCAEIREQLQVLRGGSLRRNRIRLHLEACESCRRYREEIRRDRVAAGALAGATPSSQPAVMAKGLLAKLGIAGSGVREHGVAQLCAVALATGAGVVGVATVAPNTDAKQSPTPATASPLSVESPAFVAAQPGPGGSTTAPGGPAEEKSAGGGGPLSGLLAELLGEEGLLDLSHVLGEAGIADLAGSGAVSDIAAEPSGSGSDGGSSPNDPSEGRSDRSDRGRGLLSLLLGRS